MRKPVFKSTPQGKECAAWFGAGLRDGEAKGLLKAARMASAAARAEEARRLVVGGSLAGVSCYRAVADWCQAEVKKLKAVKRG